MRIILLVFAFCSCSQDSSEKIGNEKNCQRADAIKEFAVAECKAMKTLWQVDCFCNNDGCEGRRYACFWDLSAGGLAKNPEMVDLYDVFHQKILECRSNYLKIDDVNPCEDNALSRAFLRCEERIIDFLADCDSGDCKFPDLYERAQNQIELCK